MVTDDFAVQNPSLCWILSSWPSAIRTSCTIWCRRSTRQAPKMRLGKHNTEEKEPFVIVYTFHLHHLLDETTYLEKRVLNGNASHC